MATNDELATALEVMADMADDSIAQDDLQTLADALAKRPSRRTYDELMVAVQAELGENAICEAMDFHDHDYPLYLCDQHVDQFLQEFPQWDVVDKRGKSIDGFWRNFPVPRNE